MATDIQAEVRRQVSEFMAQQAQAMNHLQCENAVLRERLDAQQSPPQLTQSINPNPKVDLHNPKGSPDHSIQEGVKRWFHCKGLVRLKRECKHLRVKGLGVWGFKCQPSIHKLH